MATTLVSFPTWGSEALVDQACAQVLQQATMTESQGLDANEVQRAIAPWSVACSNEIMASLATATPAQQRDQLKALDTLSFYFNATSQKIPFDPATVAALLLLRLDPDRADAPSKEILHALQEENRSTEWLSRAGLSAEPGITHRAPRGSTRVTTMRLIDERLRAQSVNLAEVDLVVVAGCHMAKRAAEKLRNDPEAQRLLSGLRILWMQPAGRSLKLDELEEWNATFPDAPMHVAMHNVEWVGMDLTALPTFHLLQEGKVTASHRGWSQSGETPGPLLEALRKHRGE